MTETYALMGMMVNNLIALAAGGCIRYIPLKDKLRVSYGKLAVLYGLFFLVQSGLLVLAQGSFRTGYLSGQMFQSLTGLLGMALPFVLTRRCFFQNLFLVAAVANYSLIVTGAGNYAELAWGGELAAGFPYLVSNAVKLALSALLLPPTLKMLGRMFSLRRSGDGLIWRIIWIIPTLFAVLCFMVGSFLSGTEGVTRLLFIVGRVCIGIGCVATCALLVRAFRQESENAALLEHARMTEQLLALQREQYEQLTKRIDEARAARHDLRHQLAVLKGYGASGYNDRLTAYLDELMGTASASIENEYCENHAVNAVVGHYLSMARRENVEVSVSLHIPADTGRVSEQDLCVLVGNLMENAVEACHRVAEDKRFIKLGSMMQGGGLYLTLDNSFDGQSSHDGGVWLSRKRDGAGIGIASVRAVCEKYGGSADFEAKDGVWRASAVVMLDK